ncbi:hypothetical protein [Luteimonas aquatica]|uniref:hypothetical protein n=1 Tax=Luteimonas aquatica TaxID=450364 RepID=UPI001F57F3BA|nr:hypothetical protein [Luteimonas aquatica]
MKYLMGMLLGLACWMAVAPAQAFEQGDDWIAIDLTDARTLYMRDLTPGLMLAIRKERRAGQADAGWSLEVVRRPLTAAAPNLVGGGRDGDASRILASQAGARGFSNSRELPVQGTPYTLRVELKGAKVNGKGESASFAGGKLRVSWKAGK